MRFVVGDKFPHDYEWDNGANEQGYSGINACGPVDAWRTGGVIGRDPPIVTDAQGVSTCCRMVGLLADGGFGLGGAAVFPVVPPFSAWAGGKGLGGHWVYAPQPYDVWEGGKGLGGHFEFADGPWSRFGGGKGLGGSFASAEGPTAAWSGGKGLGGAWSNASGPVGTWGGGKGLGGAWAWSGGPTSAWSGGKGLGGSFAFGEGPTSAWSGGKGLGGHFVSTDSYWSVMSGGKGLGGTFEEDTFVIPTGTILAFGGGTLPAGYLLCDGAGFNATTYAALFGVIGTTFGLDGSLNPRVPDLRRRVIMGSGGSDGGSGIGTTVGSSGGTETHTLLTAETPSHNHGESGASAFVRTGTPSFGVLGGPVNNLGTVVTTANTGGDGAHQNTQPSLVCNWMIKT